MELLEELFLNGNLINKMKGFAKCKNLKKLFITENKITKIESLEKVTSLEVLWVAENSISVLQGLRTLTKLKELNAASNKISIIGTSLDNLKQLEVLNVSDNKINNFKEILNLNRLPKLINLSIYDPHYGENPICNLCNYQTYVLYHLPRLLKFDVMNLIDDAKAYAEGTFMKKRMFYNMRIKTIQKTASNAIKLLKNIKRMRLLTTKNEITNLTRKLYETDREIGESIHLKGKIDNDGEIERKKILIEGRINDRHEDIMDIETIYQSVKRKIYDISEMNVHRMITELETGGNIRFEEGKPTDKWYKSCLDLLFLRFDAGSVWEYGLSNIAITRVTRIHNKFLRNQFEEKIEQLVDLTDKKTKRSFEYLFCGVDPNNTNEIFRIMEEGFRSPTDSAAYGLPPCVILLNSVMCADLPRVKNFFQNDEAFAQLRSATKGANYDGNLMM